MRAYVDESQRVATPGLYVLAAVAVPDHEADEVRAVLREGLRHRRLRFHWRDEEQADREAMAKIVGGLGLPTVVAVASPIDRRRSERARRVCLTRLLWELEQRQVLEVVLETRQAARDAEDRAHILRAQRAGHLTRALHYGFGQPRQEPLLWLPDLVAGAVSYAWAGDGHCLELLGATVAVVEAGSGT